MAKQNTTKEIIIYKDDNGQSGIQVRLQSDSAWLTQSQLVELYQSSKANISEHIKNIFQEGELERSSVVRNFRTVQIEGARRVTRDVEHYNLDMIISFGYRIKSSIATKFRIWATERLRDYIIKGFAINSAQLKNLGGGHDCQKLSKL